MKSQEEVRSQQPTKQPFSKSAAFSTMKMPMSEEIYKFKELPSFAEAEYEEGGSLTNISDALLEIDSTVFKPASGDRQY